MRKINSVLLAALFLITSQLFAASFSGNLTAVDTTLGPLYLRAKESMTYSLSGFGVASVQLQKTKDFQTWESVSSFSANQSSTVLENRGQEPIYVRWYVTSYTSGTIAAALADVDGDILETVHVHPYQSNREVMQIDDMARGVFPNGIELGSGTLETGNTITLQAGAAGTGSIFHDAATGVVQYCGGTTNVTGACLKLYGASHATLGGDAVLTAGDGTAVITHDDSANSITFGFKSYFPDGSDGAPTMGWTAAPTLGFYRIGATATGVSGILGVADGAVGAPGLVFSGDLDTGLYRIAANDLGIAAGGVLKIEANATGLGFFAATPVAKQGAITAAAGDDATAVNAIITALENYGLLVAN